MRVRLAVAICVGTALLVSYGRPAAAQADAHARAIARASCQSGKHSDAVVDATSAVQRAPDDLGPRMRLADALVDQGCYQEAVEILEAAQENFPRNSELAGKLRDTRSLVTEQTYIEGLTQAAESARFSRNQLRCTKLNDITACDDALRSRPDDVPLLLAKGDALMQANRTAEAVTAYRHVSQLKPGDEAVKSKLVSAEALVAKNQPPQQPEVGADAGSGGSGGSRASGTRSARLAAADSAARAKARRKAAAADAPGDAGAAGATAAASVTAAAPPVAALVPETKTYSNDAPAGQTH